MLAALSEPYQPPRLRAKLHADITSFLENKERLFELTDRYGSPLNLVFPHIIRENIEQFQKVYAKNNLRGRIHFTSKPCKSLAIYREAATQDIDIDVSSIGSLQAALDCGWDSKRISATGPKNRAYLSAAVQKNVLINVDSLHELQSIAVLPQKCQITIRIADTGQQQAHSIRTEDTAFGIHSKDMPEVFEFLQAQAGTIDFQGFSYHASMANDEQRIAAMENLIGLTLAAQGKGFKARTINLGGGFRVAYARSAGEWAAYLDSLKKSVLGKIPSQIWNNSDLGYRVENGVIRGDGAFINHFPIHTKAEEFERWLNFRLPSFGNARFMDVARDTLSQVQIEPGRALLDQCGVTIGRVAFTKTSLQGEFLAGLEMNSTNLHADKFKMLSEPIVIPQGNGQINQQQNGVYYMGNLCMAHDMMRFNKTYPEFLPQAGDLAAFANTAAYMMDFMESETLMQPTAQKIAVTRHHNAWDCVPDKDYRR